MNKTKRVAWHKHLHKAKKRHDKAHPAPTAQAAPSRQTTTRRSV